MLKCTLPLLFAFVSFQDCFGAAVIDRLNISSKQSREFVCPQPDGFFPADDKCSGSYYFCLDDIPYPQQCPGVSVFDPAVVACVDPEDASCYVSTSMETSVETTTETMTTPSTTTLPPYPTAPYTCTSDGSFPIDRNDCTQEYYSCIAGEAYYLECAIDDVFDPVTFACTPLEQASCNQKFDCTSDGLFPYPGACTHFYYVCSAGQSYLEFCPENYVFDPVTYRCVEIGSASCTPGVPTFIAYSEGNIRRN